MTESNRISNFEQVREFHTMFNHPIATQPYLDVFDANPKLVEFRISQVEEEFNELKVAVDNKDFIECIDAICDLMYFVYGSFLVFGVNFDQYEPKPKIRNFGCEKNNVDVFVSDISGLQTQISILAQALAVVQLAYEEKDFDNMLKFFAKLEAVCKSIGTLLGVDVDACFAEVHRSNMTKLCLSEDIAIQTVQTYLKLKQTRDELLSSAETVEQRAKIMEEHKAYEDPTYKYDGSKYWIVYDKATTKILKSNGFEKPKLANIIGLDLTPTVNATMENTGEPNNDTNNDTNDNTNDTNNDTNDNTNNNTNDTNNDTNNSTNDANNNTNNNCDTNCSNGCTECECKNDCNCDKNCCNWCDNCDNVTSENY